MRESKYDTKIIIYKSRRRLLILTVLLAIIAMTAAIAYVNEQEMIWQILIAPAVAVGLLLLTVPASEEWQYRPWQSKPRRVERYGD